MTADEAFGVNDKGRVEDDLALFADQFGLSMMDHRGREQAAAGMAMDVVVAREERGAEGAGVGQGTEAVGKLRAIFQGAEVAF